MIWKTDIIDEIKALKAINFISNDYLSSKGLNATSMSRTVNDDDNDVKRIKGIIKQINSNDTRNADLVLHHDSMLIDNLHGLLPYSKYLSIYKQYVLNPETLTNSDDSSDQVVAYSGNMMESLEIEYIYGYNGWNCRNNVGYILSKSNVNHQRCIFYPAGRYGVVMTVPVVSSISNTSISSKSKLELFTNFFYMCSRVITCRNIN